MASDKKKVEKKNQEKPQKGKAFVDTSNSKVVKGTAKAEVEKDDKVVVENIEVHKNNVRTASTLEEFLTDLAGYRDRLHDFAVDSGDRTQATQALYEMITGKKIEPIFDENGDEEEQFFDWDQFKQYWDEIEETAKNISSEKMKEVIDTFKYDLDGEYTGESLKQDLMKAINEALSNKTMKASDVNAWLSENNLKDVVAKLESEDGKYNVDDIIKLISDQERKELQSEVVTNLKIDEGVASEDDIDMEDENEDGKEEKDSSNTPEPSNIKESSEEKESSTDDIEFDEDDAVNEDGVVNEDETKKLAIQLLDEDKPGVAKVVIELLNPIKDSMSEELRRQFDMFIEQDITIGEMLEALDNDVNNYVDGLEEFREMAKTSENLEAFISAIRSKDDVPSEVSTAFFNKYGQEGNATPEQAAETLYNEVKGALNENVHQDMKRLFHLMSLKESANELVNKFGLTDIDSIKESLVEELTDDEYKIVLEDVYKAFNIEVENDFSDDTESLNESLRSNLHDKLI